MSIWVWVIIIAVAIFLLWLISHLGLWGILGLIFVMLVMHRAALKKSKLARFIAIDAVVGIVILSGVSAYERTVLYEKAKASLEKEDYGEAYRQVELLKKVHIKLPDVFTDSRYLELRTTVEKHFSESMIGTWDGEYTANDEVLRRMELSILSYNPKEEEYEAVFKFYPHEHQLQDYASSTSYWKNDNALSEAGAYKCTVRIDIESQNFSVYGTEWIHQPPNYVFDSCTGQLDLKELTISNEDKLFLKKISDEPNYIAPAAAPETLLSNMQAYRKSETGGLVSYNFAMDSLGSTYNNAVGGALGDELNWQDYNLAGEYTEFRGRVITNYDYRTMEDAQTYVSFFGDGQWLYTTPYIQAGSLPEDFVIDVTGVEILTVNIQGCNVARLVDCALCKDNVRKSYESRIDYGTHENKKALSELPWFNASDEYGGFKHYESASASEGNNYSDAIGGISSDIVNFEEYYLGGEYNTLSGVVLLNSEFSDSYFDNMYVGIYGDGVPLYTSPHVGPGMQPQKFTVDVTGVKVLKVTVMGQNVIRVAECILEK